MLNENKFEYDIIIKFNSFKILKKDIKFPIVPKEKRNMIKLKKINILLQECLEIKIEGNHFYSIELKDKKLKVVIYL